MATTRQQSWNLKGRTSCEPSDLQRLRYLCARVSGLLLDGPRRHRGLPILSAPAGACVRASTGRPPVRRERHRPTATVCTTRVETRSSSSMEALSGAMLICSAATTRRFREALTPFGIATLTTVTLATTGPRRRVSTWSSPTRTLTLAGRTSAAGRLPPSSVLGPADAPAALSR